MNSVLITAYGPYDAWQENASWLALVELTRALPQRPAVTTRLYPVDFQQLRRRLEQDLEAGFDVALHLGQAPGLSAIHLEAVGLNVAGERGQRPEDFVPLAHDGPPAYRSALPLSAWARGLRRAGIPCEVSYHAGTYLCNAALYLTHHLAALRGWPTRAAFLHVPLAPVQTIGRPEPLPSLSPVATAAAVRRILGWIDGSPLPSA